MSNYVSSFKLWTDRNPRFATTHTHFASTLEYAEWALDHLNSPTSKSSYYYTHVQRGAELLRDGSEDYVDEARKLLKELSQKIETPHFVWEPSIVGYFPHIPAYIAGQPENMWIREEIRTDRTPLRIYFAVSTLANITEEQIRKRGIVMAALAIALSEIRPVYVTPWVDLATTRRGSIVSWDVRTSPLVLSQLMVSVSNPDVTRYLGVDACQWADPNVTSTRPHPDYTSADRMRQHLGAKPDDLVIPELLPGDPLLDNPLQWLKDQVAHYSGQDNQQ